MIKLLGPGAKYPHHSTKVHIDPNMLTMTHMYDSVIRFTKRNGYRPIVYLNDWWNLQSDYKPINKTDESLELNLTFQPYSLFKVSMTHQ